MASKLRRYTLIYVDDPMDCPFRCNATCTKVDRTLEKSYCIDNVPRWCPLPKEKK